MGIQRRPCEDCGGQLHFDTDQPANAKVGFTLDTYAHVMPGQQADAVKAVAKLVDGELSRCDHSVTTAVTVTIEAP